MFTIQPQLLYRLTHRIDAIAVKRPGPTARVYLKTCSCRALPRSAPALATEKMQTMTIYGAGIAVIGLQRAGRCLSRHFREQVLVLGQHCWS